MSETILNFINNTLKLPNKIKNIEREFKNGFLFGQLLQKSGHFKGRLGNYIENPKNNSEIKDNYKYLQKDLHLMEIFINNSTINNLMSGKEGEAPKLIYKIKTEIDRIKINFSSVVEKINQNSYREKYELGKNKIINNLNKNRILELTQSNKFSMSPSITTRETLSTFTNFFLKPKDKIHKKFLLSEDNKLNVNDSKYTNVKSKFKLKPIRINEEQKEKGKLFKSSKTMLGLGPLQNFESQKSNEKDNNIIETINDEDENIYNKYILSTPETNISKNKLYKNKSKSLYNKKTEKITINASNNKRNDLFNSDKYIKYSVFDNNTKKLGINVNEIAPRLKKTGIYYNNDYYLDANQVANDFRDILWLKKQEKKNKSKNSGNKNLIMTKENFLKNSIIEKNNEEDKLFSIKFNKNSSLYKMHEYDKLISSQNKNFNKTKKYFIKENSYNYSQDETETKFFDADEYINIVNNKNKEDSIKIKNTKKNYNEINEITHLIIDFVDECYRSQIKLEEELVELEDYREWSKYFIEGKSCLKIPIKRRNKNDISKNEKDSGILTNNSSMLTKFTKKSNKKKEQKNNINNNELISMEYIDYLFYRGNWEINNFVKKNQYGKYLHIYNILEDDIFKIIPSVNNLFHGFKPSLLLEKKNHDFELKEEELTNIYIPKSNIRNSLLGEIIFLNYDNSSNLILNNIRKSSISSPNIINEIKINNIDENKLENTEQENNINSQKEKDNKMNDYSYIPIKICLFGHSFSGRKTQAKLLSEKYKNLKSYSINEITQFYINEYNRLHTPIEKNPKFKTMKKNQITQMKENMEEELKQYHDIFILLEKYYNKNKEEENFDIEKISDELKIKLFIYQIKKDFPKKNENEINEQIQERIQKKQKLEEEINKIKETMETETSHNNNKDNKKAKLKPKKNGNNLNSLTEELEKIINESFEGFILYDFPNTYEQYLKLENITTGFIQPIEQEPDKRDIYMNILTTSIDKPYINISNLNKEVKSFLNTSKTNNSIQKSFFNSYIFLELSEEETLKRMNNRLRDPNSGIIYHQEYSPPNSADKKLMDRLVKVDEPNDEKIKELITQFYLEYPNILYFINLFNNLYVIDQENKEEIFHKIEDIILGEIKKYEESEDKDILGNLLNQNFEMNDDNEEIKYFVRLNETKKIISKEISEDIIKSWYEEQDKYIKGVRSFIKKFEDMKVNILEQMDVYQEEFIDFLNSSSKKYKIVDIFYKKYNILLEKFPYFKNNHLFKEEFDKNINELIDHLWEMIQMRKRDAIVELNNIKKHNFIENQFDIFGSYIIDLFIIETKRYYDKINLIKKFYYEFDKQKIAEKFPYEYKLDEDKIIEGINEYPIFIADISKKGQISPKIEKLYKNCYKLFFIYDNEINQLKNKYKEEYIMNNSNSTGTRQKRRLKSFKKNNTIKSEMSILSDNKNYINYEEEMKAALSNEKIKYKIRILFLKHFAEKNLKEIYDIGQKTFSCLDNHIIESVNSQNEAMNILIQRIRRSINEGNYKLNIKDVELDLFDIFEKSNLNFSQFNLNYLYTLPEQDKIINYNYLKMVFLDVKNFEIQKNYVTLNLVIDIVFKKHLFEHKSPAFMKYMHQIPFLYINNFINKYIIKKDKGYSVIKLNELFTSLALLNIVPPKNEEAMAIMKSINDKLKYKKYLTKIDFMNCKLWFEKNENNAEYYNYNYEENHLKKNLRNTTISLNKNTDFGQINLNEKKTKRSSMISHQTNELNILDKDIPDEIKLKEFLFNINKNDDELIDFTDFMKRIVIKKNTNTNQKNRKSIKFNNGPIDIKSNIDKADILSQNSFMESVDKTQLSESTTNYFKGSKNLVGNNLSSIANNLKEDYKMKSYKSQKLNDTFRELSEERINNNINEIINFPDYTYFDYFMKKI